MSVTGLIGFLCVLGAVFFATFAVKAFALPASQNTLKDAPLWLRPGVVIFLMNPLKIVRGFYRNSNSGPKQIIQTFQP